jgi:hypothetical protein
MSETNPTSKTRRYEGLKIVAPTRQPKYDKPALMQKLQDARAKTQSLEQKLSKVVNSVSWRITAPLRLAKQASKSTLERMRGQQTRATDAHSSEGKDTNVES